MFESLTDSLWKKARNYAEGVRKSAQHDQEKCQPDFTHFLEPEASKIEWTPNSSGGANFRTGKLVMGSDGQPMISGTGGMKLFGLIFCGLGCMALFGMTPLFFTQEMNGVMRLFVLIPLSVGMIFFIFGLLMVESSFRQFRFEKRGLVRPASLIAPYVSHVQLQELFIPKDEMVGVQIVAEKVHDSDGPDYFSFELNLVTHTFSRITLEDHKELESIRLDGERLAKFLGIPLWDGTVGKF